MTQEQERNPSQNSSSKKSLLFVCTGHICRSPTAEALFEAAVKAGGLAHLTHDSAGVDSHHIGQMPDPRTRAVAKAHGTPMDHLVARNVHPSDFENFDVILAMDDSHYNALMRMKPANAKAEVALYLAYAGITERADVPDPYYGETVDFEYVYELLTRANNALLAKLNS